MFLGTSNEITAQKWRNEGRNSVVLDLNIPEGFAQALAGIDSVFLSRSHLMLDKTADMGLGNGSQFR